MGGKALMYEGPTLCLALDEMFIGVYIERIT